MSLAVARNPPAHLGALVIVVSGIIIVLREAAQPRKEWRHGIEHGAS